MIGGFDRRRDFRDQVAKVDQFAPGRFRFCARDGKVHHVLNRLCQVLRIDVHTVDNFAMLLRGCGIQFVAQDVDIAKQGL